MCRLAHFILLSHWSLILLFFFPVWLSVYCFDWVIFVMTPEPQHPASTCPIKGTSEFGECQAPIPTDYAGLSTLPSTNLLLRSLLRLPTCLSPIPADLSTSEVPSPGMKTFSFSLFPPVPFSLSFSLFLLSYPVMWRFSYHFGSLRSAVFSRCSARIVPRGCILMYLWENMRATYRSSAVLSCFDCIYIF